MARQRTHKLSALCFKIMARCKENVLLPCLSIAIGRLTPQIVFDFETHAGAAKMKPNVVKTFNHRYTMVFRSFLVGSFIFDTRTRSLYL